MSNQSDLAKSAAGFNGDPLSIDTANNRVGIGNNSPQSSLAVYSSSASNYSSTVDSTTNMSGIRVTASPNESVMTGIWFGTGGDQTGSHWTGIAGSRTNHTVDWGTRLSFYTHPTATTSASQTYERMIIDPAGRVTMPYQPHGAWTQTLTSTPSVSILRNNGPVSSVSVSSTGQNGTIGRFTAPVAGLYHFNVTTSQITAGSSNLLVVIYVNGTLGGTYSTNAIPPTGEIIDMRSASNIQDGPAYSHAIYLSSSDYVEFSVYRITTGYTDSGNIICSAYLIG